MFGYCAVASALTALIKDRVPHEQRGTVSGWMSMAQAGGLIVGLGSVALFSLVPSVAYPLMAVLLVACVVPFVLAPATEAPVQTHPPVSPASSGSVMRLLENHDFRWALTGRVVVSFGSALATCLLIFYLQFDLRIGNPDEALLVLTIAYIASVIGVSVLGGRWSDRVGRRKPFIVGSALVQTFSTLMFFLADDLWAATLR
jgi:MFS family permease